MKPKLDHLKRRGYRVVESLFHEVDEDGNVLKDKDGITFVRTDLTIIARRSRKEWFCAAHTGCVLNGSIGFDEIYIEVAEGVSRFNGRTKRYHMPCALRAEIIEKEADALDKTNNRRAAIAMTKAKREAARGC